MDHKSVLLRRQRWLCYYNRHYWDKILDNEVHKKRLTQQHSSKRETHNETMIITENNVIYADSTSRRLFPMPYFEVYYPTKNAAKLSIYAKKRNSFAYFFDKQPSSVYLYHSCIYSPTVFNVNYQIALS